MRSDWIDADGQSRKARDEERREAGEERGGERGHDLKGERLRVERDEGRDEHAETPCDDAREHGVHDRQAARGEPGEHGRDLVLRRGPRRQSERRPPKERRQHRRDDDHDPREQEPVLRDDSVEDRHRVRRGGPTGADFRLLPKIKITRPPGRAGGRATRPAWRAGPCSEAGERWPARSGRRTRPCRRA